MRSDAVAENLQAQMAASFEERLDELHEMLYRRGGIRPVNAAIEELTKLLLLQVVRQRDPDFPVGEGLTLAQAISPKRITARGDVEDAKAAFTAVIGHPDVGARVPDGGTQTLWPVDEPLRITRADVLAEALDILGDAVELAMASDERYDPLGTAFDVFLRGRYDHAGGLATHLTPHTVVTHLARLCLHDLDLLDTSPVAPVVGDPCCGTGRFLLGALRELRTSLDAIDPSDPHRLARERALQKLRQDGLLGADQSASSVAKARVNLLLHGIAHPFVFTVEDSITSRSLDPLAGTLKLILTNPPFGDGKYDDVEGIARTTRLLPGCARRARIDPALAFVVRCLDLLAPGGRLGIILPDGLIDGLALKRALISGGGTAAREASIEANISLPTVTFALSGTVARTSAVVIRKEAASRSTVFIARADHVGYLKQAGVAVADPAGDDLPTITARGLASWSDEQITTEVERTGVLFVSEQPLAAFVIRDGLGSVDPGRIDPAALSARAELRESGGLCFSEMLRPIRRRAARARLDTPFVSVLHVNDLGAVRWHEAANYRPTTPGQVAYTGEILVSLLNPSKLRACVVPEDYEEILCSSEFGIFTTDADPWEVLVLLHDERVKLQLAPLGRGTSSSRRRIEPQDLLGLHAPLVESDELAARGASVRASLDVIRVATLQLAAVYDSSGSPGSASSSEASATATETPVSLAGASASSS
jgi:type I restriction enzyme M protein